MATLYSPLLERALRFAADQHRSQNRKASSTPYITHPMQVAWILERAGFNDESLLAAALLHDVVEDCNVGLMELRKEFSPAIARLVDAMSEQKLDSAGCRRPWEDRKREHLAQLPGATVEVKALMLADKLHNLETIALDLQSGDEVWSRFNAPKERLLWYYTTAVDACAGDDPRLVKLVTACREVLQRLR
jgi:(p)ppGpp synthase/HD superfamily hydrolase